MNGRHTWTSNQTKTQKHKLSYLQVHPYKQKCIDVQTYTEKEIEKPIHKINNTNTHTYISNYTNTQKERLAQWYKQSHIHTNTHTYTQKQRHQKKEQCKQHKRRIQT